MHRLGPAPAVLAVSIAVLSSVGCASAPVLEPRAEPRADPPDETAPLTLDAESADTAWIDAAIALAEGGDPEGALPDLRRAVEQQPENAHAWHALASALYVKRDYENAAGALRGYIGVVGGEAWPHLYLGICLLRTGRPQGALTEFDRAVALHADAATRVWQGQCLNALGRHEEAVSRFRQALELDPSEASAHYNLGVACWCLGRLEDAIDAYRAALRLQPDATPALVALGSAYLDRNEPFEAEAYLRKALDLDPADDQARLRLARCLAETHRVDDACELLMLLVARRPDWGAAWLELGRAEAARGNLATAVKRLRAAVALDGDDAFARETLAYWLVRVGESDAALEEYRAAARLQPNPRVLYVLGRLLYDRREYEESLEKFEEGLRTDPRDAHCLYGRALAASALGFESRVEDAKARLRKVDRELADALEEHLLHEDGVDPPENPR